ncbi:MAG: MFS transporter, partial [Candidatus Solibacter sp.]|nr:MFS transporter [Candidatus Solibacter sp.]
MRWFVLAMLLAVTSINYLDRLLLSVLAPVLRDYFHFTEHLYGNVNAAFQIFYGFGFLASGILIDRYGVKKGLAAGAAVWSVVSAMHASVTGAAQFGVWRAMLGLAEAVNFPACTKTVAEWFPAEERALATGIFNAGPNLAAVVGPPLFITLEIWFGWRVCFVAVSLIGLLWVAVWLKFYPARRTPEASRNGGGFGFREALRFRQTRGYALSKVLVDPVWYFLLFWLPLYFRDVRGLEMRQIGWALPCIYFASGAGSVTAGWLSGFLLGRGKSTRAARMATLAICSVVPPVALFCALRGTLTQTVVMFSAAAAAHQAFSSISFTLPGDVFPSRTLGTILGVGSFA